LKVENEMGCKVSKVDEPVKVEALNRRDENAYVEYYDNDCDRIFGGGLGNQITPSGYY